MLLIVYTMKKLLLAVIVSIGCIAYVNAQTDNNWETEIEQLGLTTLLNTQEGEEAYNYLCELAEHPLNINTATKDDLERLPFLTARQIEDILSYIYKYGAMRSIGELALISSININTRKLISFFVFVGEENTRKYPTLSDILRKGKQELAATIKIPFYKKKGDDTAFWGYPQRHWIRYNFTLGSYVKP